VVLGVRGKKRILYYGLGASHRKGQAKMKIREKGTLALGEGGKKIYVFLRWRSEPDQRRARVMSCNKEGKREGITPAPRKKNDEREILSLTVMTK